MSLIGVQPVIIFQEMLDEEIMENATNSGKLAELTQQKEETEEALNEKMDRWVYLNDLAEQIANQ